MSSGIVGVGALLVAWPLLTLARGALWAWRALSCLAVGGGWLLRLLPRIGRWMLWLVARPVKPLRLAILGLGRAAR